MSYQVLARKYRPANFQELEGQEHVLQALVNSLEQNRLHHAYLFTGTRGVGKTTIARILAKCFNCESGITSKPCGVCGSCREIADGRSVDLIEVDAASRTRVEDTRELLENVQYMPSASRFKVYLIDEVHMLSNHSFNALLKTLEEPPAHVKFLLATTDPKKLPVTVLSRCLQFNLKNLSPERVVKHLTVILQAENIKFEEAALWHLGRAADGSMRDALSLTDQAISYGANELTEGDVRAMLGAIDQQAVFGLLDTLVARDAAGMLERVSILAEFGPDYEMLLGAVLSVLHRIAVAQAVPAGVDNSRGDREKILALSKRLGREEVQLYYQIGLIGQRDLPLAPLPRDGFEMVLLRMLAFAPDHLLAAAQEPAAGSSSPAPETGATRASPISSILSSIGNQTTAPRVAAAPIKSTPPPVRTISPPPVDTTDEIPWGDAGVRKPSSRIVEPRPKVQAEPVPTPTAAPVIPAEPAADSTTDWETLFLELDLSGVTRTLAANCVMGEMSAARVVLILGEQHASLLNATHEARIQQALTKRLGRATELKIEVACAPGETPAAAQERREQVRRASAVDAIMSDQNVQQIIEAFNGKLDKGSIMPRSQAGE